MHKIDKIFLLCFYMHITINNRKQKPVILELQVSIRFCLSVVIDFNFFSKLYIYHVKQSMSLNTLHFHYFKNMLKIFINYIVAHFPCRQYK